MYNDSQSAPLSPFSPFSAVPQSQLFPYQDFGLEPYGNDHSILTPSLVTGHALQPVSGHSAGAGRSIADHTIQQVPGHSMQMDAAGQISAESALRAAWQNERSSNQQLQIAVTNVTRERDILAQLVNVVRGHYALSRDCLLTPEWLQRLLCGQAEPTTQLAPPWLLTNINQAVRSKQHVTRTVSLKVHRPEQPQPTDEDVHITVTPAASETPMQMMHRISQLEGLLSISENSVKLLNSKVQTLTDQHKSEIQAMQNQHLQESSQYEIELCKMRTEQAMKPIKRTVGTQTLAAPQPLSKRTGPVYRKRNPIPLTQLARTPAGRRAYRLKKRSHTSSLAAVQTSRLIHRDRQS